MPQKIWKQLRSCSLKLKELNTDSPFLKVHLKGIITYQLLHNSNVESEDEPHCHS